MPKPGTIHLHIDSLVLRGFDTINEAALSAALQEALSHELQAMPPMRDTSLAHARTSISLPAGYDASALGNMLAQTITGIACPDIATPREPRHG